MTTGRRFRGYTRGEPLAPLESAPVSAPEPLFGNREVGLRALADIRQMLSGAHGEPVAGTFQQIAGRGLVPSKPKR